MKKIIITAALLCSFLYVSNAHAWVLMTELGPVTQQLLKSLEETAANANKAVTDSLNPFKMQLENFLTNSEIQANKEMLIFEQTQKLQDKIEGLPNDLCDQEGINAAHQNAVSAAYKIQQSYASKMEQYTKIGTDENVINKILAGTNLENKEIAKIYSNSINEENLEVYQIAHLNAKRHNIPNKIEETTDVITGIQNKAENTKKILVSGIIDNAYSDNLAFNFETFPVKDSAEVQRMIENVTNENAKNNSSYKNKYENREKISLAEFYELRAAQYVLNPDVIKEDITRNSEGSLGIIIRLMADQQLLQLREVKLLENIQFLLIENNNELQDN